MISDYFSSFFWGHVLIKVIAWFDQNSRTHGACAYATSSGHFAFFFYAEFLYRIFECFQHFEGAEGNATAGAANINAVFVGSLEIKFLFSYSLEIINFQF